MNANDDGQFYYNATALPLCFQGSQPTSPSTGTLPPQHPHHQRWTHLAQKLFASPSSSLSTTQQYHHTFLLPCGLTVGELAWYVYRQDMLPPTDVRMTHDLLTQLEKQMYNYMGININSWRDLFEEHVQLMALHTYTDNGRLVLRKMLKNFLFAINMKDKGYTQKLRLVLDALPLTSPATTSTRAQH
jgi:hypothetical protein